MKVVNIGNTYEIYDDCLKTFDKLPAKTYMLRFSQMSGFYLEEYAELETKEETVYGIHDVKVDKVMKTFEGSNRNLGIILSGDKGIGKSLFARMLANKAIDNDYPVIIVNKYYPGLESYIEKINQEAMYLLDEFDKTFANISSSDNNVKPQANMLSLFDGITPGKKMFVITCNDFRSLNEYLINRPGRFHYHFRFKYPVAEEVTKYLMDKLDEKNYGEIDKVVMFSRKVNLNYDCLRAIAYELNLGETFEDAIQDLNIINLENNHYDVVLHFSNGSIMQKKHAQIDMFGKSDYVNLVDAQGKDLIKVTFNPTHCTFDPMKRESVIMADMINVTRTDYYDDEDYKILESIVPEYMTISKCVSKEYHYAV